MEYETKNKLPQNFKWVYSHFLCQWEWKWSGNKIFKIFNRARGADIHIYIKSISMMVKLGYLKPVKVEMKN